MTKVRHVLGISGGKDSAALAIYMKQKYPTLKVEYYNSDTGCELEETEKLVDNLESFLGKVERLKAAEGSPESTPFDHFLKISGVLRHFWGNPICKTPLSMDYASLFEGINIQCYKMELKKM